MYNIKQITNFSIEDLQIDPIPRRILVGNQKEKNVYYKNIIFPNTQNIIKIGYCCEPRAISIPIYLKINTDTEKKPFYIGKTGMFEVQPESWKNINDEESQEQEYEITITEIDIPSIIEGNDEEVNFKLDYIY